jgi:hypothetical protein
MMKRSHDRKPLRMLLGSVHTSEASVRKLYGIENEITIEGPAGTGLRSRYLVLPPSIAADPGRSPYARGSIYQLST